MPRRFVTGLSSALASLLLSSCAPTAFDRAEYDRAEVGRVAGKKMIASTLTTVVVVDEIDDLAEIGGWNARLDRYALVPAGEHVFLVRRRVEDHMEQGEANLIGPPYSTVVELRRFEESLATRRRIRFRVDGGHEYEIFGSNPIDDGPGGARYFVRRTDPSERGPEIHGRNRLKKGNFEVRRNPFEHRVPDEATECVEGNDGVLDCRLPEVTRAQ